MGEQDVADQQGAFSRRGAGPPFSNGRDSRLLGAATPVGVRVSPVVHLIGDPLPWFIHTFESCLSPQDGLFALLVGHRQQRYKKQYHHFVALLVDAHVAGFLALRFSLGARLSHLVVPAYIRATAA